MRHVSADTFLTVEDKVAIEGLAVSSLYLETLRLKSESSVQCSLRCVVFFVGKKESG